MVAVGRRRFGRAGFAPALLAAALVWLPGARAGDLGAPEKLPRFASLRSSEVNLRVGPGRNYPIEWVLTRKGMPVEILREFEHWRKIRDWQGTEGWVHQRMVSGKREVIVTGAVRALRQRPDAGSAIVARAEPGVLAKLIECRAKWCRIEASDITGWVRRDEVWGVLPDEASP
jgi:SH3-like domain-containing protein